MARSTPSDASRTPSRRAPAEPRRGRSGYDPASVLDIAVAAFIEHGYDATSMGALADRLGLSKSAIYHHFPSKGDLLRLALDRCPRPRSRACSSRRMPSPGLPWIAWHSCCAARCVVLVDKLPYVTLLLRVHGNTDVERDALDRRRAFDRTRDQRS